MKNSKNATIARRYAKSLIELNKEDKVSYDDIKQSLDNVKEILSNSKDLFDVLDNPVISAHDKEEIINTVFQQDSNEIVINFLKLLINKNRFSSIFDIVDVYDSELNKIKNIEKVAIVCAVELNEENQQKVQKELENKLKKEIKVNYTVDDNIIAGLVFKIGDNVVDTSLAYKLEKFKKEIIK